MKRVLIERGLTALLLLSLPFLLKAQRSELRPGEGFRINTLNEFYSVIDFEVTEVGEIRMDLTLLPAGYTSMKIELSAALNTPLQIGYMQKDNRLNYRAVLVNLNTDETFDNRFSSKLEIFDTAQNELRLNFGKYKGSVKIHLIYAPPVLNFSTSQKLFKSSDKCHKPAMISYTVWRTGLPDPKPPRLETDVEHLVVHQSAGSNSDTNYINVVRNIYLLHTQSNGWDDIGYNYLVASNGTIFIGRDPQGVADDDNILGAHFCGKNQNTMGICMMGDFMLTKPTTYAVFSLKYLLAWKLKRDGINAFGQTKHPQATGSLLGNICGHRDGCNTDCPGDLLYTMLPDLKKEAARIADSCGLVLGFDIQEAAKGFTLFPNPCNGKVTVSAPGNKVECLLNLYNSKAESVFTSGLKSGQTFELFLPPGLYFYTLKEKNTVSKKGRLIIEN